MMRKTTFLFCSLLLASAGGWAQSSEPDLAIGSIGEPLTSVEEIQPGSYYLVYLGTSNASGYITTTEQTYSGTVQSEGARRVVVESGAPEVGDAVSDKVIIIEAAGDGNAAHYRFRFAATDGYIANRDLLDTPVAETAGIPVYTTTNTADATFTLTFNEGSEDKFRATSTAGNANNRNIINTGNPSQQHGTGLTLWNQDAWDSKHQSYGIRLYPVELIPNHPEIDTEKFYRIYNGRADEYMSSSSLVRNATGVVAGNIETAALQDDELGTLWQFEEASDGGYLLRNLNADAYYVASSENSAVAEASAASVFTLYGTSMDAVTFYINNTSDEHRYLNARHSIQNTGSHAIGTWNGGSDDAGNVWELTPVESVNIAVSAAGYSTINLPFSVELPDDVTAYYATGEADGAIYLTAIDGSEVPAGTPVLLSAEEGDYELTIIPAAQNEALAGNSFVGTELNTTVPSEVNAYILAKKETDDVAKFYQLSETEDERTIGANKAYYVGEDATGQAFTLKFGGTTTGIGATPTTGVDQAEIYYDLSGRRVLYPAKGIYVKANGQKVFIK